MDILREKWSKLAKNVAIGQLWSTCVWPVNFPEYLGFLGLCPLSQVFFY
jgi:hypothetical protein